MVPQSDSAAAHNPRRICPAASHSARISPSGTDCQLSTWDLELHWSSAGATSYSNLTTAYSDRSPTSPKA
ncbi:uncharacterized protein K441DRAFT_663430, partial [Cenococcum geophilum 1.58]|uniref:uncharacterized protein n=1 Tax=Cenococcum geophilum 1.58 TaxID=794803 RepID=UPI00358E3386